MSARQATTTVKVLHRATDNPYSSDSDSAQDSNAGDPQQLQAANKALEQRLEQAKATSASERKRLADDVKIERAGRQRAEELLVKQAKELESVTAAKGRLEEAFSRSISDLRYWRLEHQQAEETIQQLLRELMLLREVVSRVTSLNSNTAAAAAAGGGYSSAGGGAQLDAASGRCSPGGAYSTAGSAGGSGVSNPGVSAAAAAAVTGQNAKRISKSKLLCELHQLRQAQVAAESRQQGLLARLGALEAEKERVEESQEMISRETAKLLDDKRKLINDLGSKDDAVRGLEAGLDHLHHQLELALTDRQLLLHQLSRVADKGEMEALQQLLEEGGGSRGLQQVLMHQASGDEEQYQQLEQLEQLEHGLEHGLENGLQQQQQGEGLGGGSQAVMA